MKKEYVVRVCLYDKTEELDLIECLRYAGVVTSWFPDGNTFFDLYCPDPVGLDSQSWAEQKAAKFVSHGFNAVAAPRQSTRNDSIDGLMRIAKDTKKVFHLSKDTGFWHWSNGEDGDLSNGHVSFVDCLQEAVNGE